MFERRLTFCGRVCKIFKKYGKIRKGHGKFRKLQTRFEILSVAKKNKYPKLGKGKSSTEKGLGKKDMLVSRRVVQTKTSWWFQPI